jgi:hypothetical protein
LIACQEVTLRCKPCHTKRKRLVPPGDQIKAIWERIVNDVQDLNEIESLQTVPFPKRSSKPPVPIHARPKTSPKGRQIKNYASSSSSSSSSSSATTLKKSPPTTAKKEVVVDYEDEDSDGDDVFEDSDDDDYES